MSELIMPWANSSAAATTRSKHGAHPDWLHVEGKRIQRQDYSAKHVDNVPFKHDLATRQPMPVMATCMKSP
jgi:hypothetical protein